MSLNATMSSLTREISDRSLNESIAKDPTSVLLIGVWDISNRYGPGSGSPPGFMCPPPGIQEFDPFVQSSGPFQDRDQSLLNSSNISQSVSTAEGSF